MCSTVPFVKSKITPKLHAQTMENTNKMKQDSLCTFTRSNDIIKTDFHSRRVLLRFVFFFSISIFCSGFFHVAVDGGICFFICHSPNKQRLVVHTSPLIVSHLFVDKQLQFVSNLYLTGHAQAHRIHNTHPTVTLSIH